MQPQRNNLAVYFGPVTAILLVLLGCWWYFGMLKQRVRDKPLAPNTERWRPKSSPYPVDGAAAPTGPDASRQR